MVENGEKIKVKVLKDTAIGPIGRIKRVKKGEVFEARMYGRRFVAYNKDGTILGIGYPGFDFEIVEENVVKDLAYFKKNAEEDYLKVPISVLRYIIELERAIEEQKQESHHSGIERDLGD